MKTKTTSTAAWMVAVGLAGIASVVACSSDDGGGTVVPTNDDGGGIGRPGEGGAAAGCGTSTTCGSACVDTKNDPANCGACGKACGAGEVCTQGACGTTCPGGQEKCDVGGKAACVSLDRDSANCGACGRACASGEVCSNGACGLSCQVSYALCSGAPYVPPASDAGAADAASDAMVDAAPVPPVQDAGTRKAYCAPLQTDDDNCGACGKSCAYGEKCAGGACCGQGLLGCSGACADPRSDESHCGGCGTRCAAGQQCWAGRCNAACPPGATEVAGECTTTFDVPVANAIGLTQSCGGGHHYNNCTQNPIGVRFTDTGNATPARLDVAFNVGVSCGAYRYPLLLNGTEVGSLTAYGNCACPAAPEVNEVTIAGSALAPFRPGQPNELTLGSLTTCTGLSENATWAGAVARLRARY